MTPLRRRMIEDMRIRNLSPQTQRVYVEQVSRFARHFGQPPERLGPHEIRAWQILPGRGDGDFRRPARFLVAVAALRFVYTVTLKQPWIVEDDIPTCHGCSRRNSPLCRARRRSPGSWTR